MAKFIILTKLSNEKIILSTRYIVSVEVIEEKTCLKVENQLIQVQESFDDVYKLLGLETKEEVKKELDLSNESKEPKASKEAPASNEPKASKESEASKEAPAEGDLEFPSNNSFSSISKTNNEEKKEEEKEEEDPDNPYHKYK